jgi:hypothetical protein
MTYTTLEVQFIHGHVALKEPGTLPECGHGLLTILPDVTGLAEAQPQKSRRVVLPIIRGDGSRIINPTNTDLDASLWD